jgi:hypothetical protein
MGMIRSEVGGVVLSSYEGYNSSLGVGEAEAELRSQRRSQLPSCYGGLLAPRGAGVSLAAVLRSLLICSLFVCL